MIKSPIQLRRVSKSPNVAEGLDNLLEIKKTLKDLQDFKVQAEQEHRAKLAEMDTHIATAHEHLQRATKIQKGDKGDSIKGDKGDTPAIRDIIAAVIPHIPKPIKGDMGDTPAISDIVKEVLKKIPAPKEVKAPVIDHEKIATIVLDSIQKKKKLKIGDIDGFEQTMAPIRHLAAGFRGGGDTVAAGSGVSITISNGVKTISATGSAGTSVYNEVVSGSGNTFTLAHTPIAGTVRVYERGQRILPTINYTLTGSIITTVDTLSAGDLNCDYSW
jgi:hypothetical protein